MPGWCKRLAPLAIGALVLVSGGSCRRGAEPERLVATCEPADIVADDSFAYLSCRTTIERVPLSGGTPQKVVDDADGPYRLTLWNDELWWTTRGPPLRIKRAPRGGGTPTLVKQWGPSTSGERGPRICADATGIYTSDGVLIDPATGTERSLATPKVGTFVIGAIDATSFYWARHAVGEPGTVGKVAKAGGEPRVLASDKWITEEAIALTEEHVYYCVQRLANAEGGIDGGLFRVPKSGGTPERVLADCGHHLRVVAGAACWSHQSSYSSKLAHDESGSVACAPMAAGSTKPPDAYLFRGARVVGPVVRGRFAYWVGRPKGNDAQPALYRAPLPVAR